MSRIVGVVQRSGRTTVLDTTRAKNAKRTGKRAEEQNKGDISFGGYEVRGVWVVEERNICAGEKDRERERMGFSL
jgi:hypothetical protein